MKRVYLIGDEIVVMYRIYGTDIVKVESADGVGSIKMSIFSMYSMSGSLTFLGEL